MVKILCAGLWMLIVGFSKQYYVLIRHKALKFYLDVELSNGLLAGVTGADV